MNLGTFKKLKDFVEKLPNEISIFIATLSDTSYELNIKKLNADSLKKSLKIIAGYFPPATTYSNILKFNEFNIAEKI